MFQLLDTEFARLSPTWKTQGGNPGQPPEGARAKYSTPPPADTDDPNARPVLVLSFEPLGPGPNGTTLPSLDHDGRDGIYVGTGALGISQVIVEPAGSISEWATETHDVEVRASEPNALNSTFGAPAAETTPA